MKSFVVEQPVEPCVLLPACEDDDDPILQVLGNNRNGFNLRNKTYVITTDNEM